MSRNGDSCTTCVARRRKCDGIRPLCRRCTRDGVECKGYSTPKLPIRGVSGPKKPRSTLPISTTDVIDLTPSGLTSSGNYPGPSSVSNISTREPGIPPEWPNVGDTFSSPVPYVSHNNRPSLDPLLAINLQPSAPIPRQAPAPPYHPTDIGPFDEVTRTFVAPKKDVRQSMTPGQASLFDALFSLARPEDDIHLLASSNLLDRTPLGPIQAGPSYNLTYGAEHNLGNRDQTDLEDSHDAQEVGAKLCDTLALDKKVKSNTLPFVLQSYALWMRQFLFEPIRIIPLAREYTLEEYSTGSAARWRMTTISNAVRAITGSTGYTLEDLEILQFNMHQGFATTKSSFGTDRVADRIRALQAMSTTYEFISVSLKVLPLSKLVKTMQAVAPIFRRGCPDPEDRPVNLPTLLSNINVGLQYYATVDVLLSAVIGRPMNFRYDTTYGFGVYESIFDLENGPGTRWVYGVPDRLIIIFARMNALLEEFGSGVDLRIVRELETEIKETRAIVVASTDPSLAVGRLVVQECWRQAAYIYLYMGLCGADSHDARVIKAHGDFMEVFLRTKPGRIPDSFLVFPLPILGIATRHPDDQDLLKRRMLALPECARKETSGNQFIRMLECMWQLASQSGRPTIWSDLRLASLYVAGV
ncbi:Protein SIP4 [Saccharomyces cerevisiae S288c] [Rhizoctonia solani]|uniref:Protein SIP4 [Saccharomyces cerevisiae S288c] n=1 Tax=Rhizoctonia solani TaxID=456999 RepID=A0A0K6GAD5_9AGAM|nr:Protein SIP4 [Saccharomyces cerevisiae S288c] [Rhizoctonia solani]